MISSKRNRVFTATILIALFLIGCTRTVEEIARPEEIRSKREVVYDKVVYNGLAEAWKIYYENFPSENAYANWMYAARYAGHENYEVLLNAGLKKYPANPTLLYLAGILRHGAVDNEEGKQYLERAVMLDPSYSDPWFSLVGHYMEESDMEQLDVALRRILEHGAVAEEVMDYSYNMLLCMEQNGILITNGDNDTFPGWILTRILDHRPDIRIVNRSLLNTDWYPQHVIREGVPRFITTDELENLKKMKIYEKGDSLIALLVDAAEEQNRPVYFALTLYNTDIIKRISENGIPAGLVTRVTSGTSVKNETRRIVKHWLEDFRTTGIDTWKIQQGRTTAADHGRGLTLNYVSGLLHSFDLIEKYAPEYSDRLFKWYLEHCINIIPDDKFDEYNSLWCQFNDVKTIREWCEQQGYN